MEIIQINWTDVIIGLCSIVGFSASMSLIFGHFKLIRQIRILSDEILIMRHRSERD